VNSGLRIALVPLGEVDRAVLTWLAEDLPGIFSAQVEICPVKPLGKQHFVKDRGQYLADGLLGDFSSMVQAPGTLLLGVTEVDLFSPGLNFVFGIANRGRALISVRQLRPEFYGPPRKPDGFLVSHRPSGPSGMEPNVKVFRRRVLIEAVHELGHALGLPHCEFPGCVMFFSNWIGDTDRKGPGFCFRCARALERLVATEGP
jgi:archaemetzincin